MSDDLFTLMATLITHRTSTYNSFSNQHALFVNSLFTHKLEIARTWSSSTGKILTDDYMIPVQNPRQLHNLRGNNMIETTERKCYTELVVVAVVPNI